jgi:predicted DnaQ family exonuclease/DinG family helicase
MKKIYSTLPDKFVAFDVETTGMDYKTDRVIELAGVLFEQGRATSEFQQLVNPGKPLPPIITSLTGITREQVKKAPRFKEVADSFLEFIGDNVLVAHNIHFDMNFLSNELKRIKKKRIKNKTLDSVILCRMALPGFPNHRLKTLAPLVNEENDNLHRALHDALTCGRLIVKADNLLHTYPASVRRTMYDIIHRNRTYLREYVQALAEIPESEEAPFSSPPAETAAKLSPVTGTDPVPDGEINEFLGKKGHLFTHMPGFEFREQQLSMALEVNRAYALSRIACVEAGTGTGKTLGYLIPSILWSVKNSRRIIISTKTKNLQEQLHKKDIPLLQKIMTRKFSSIILKGRSNYLCMRRWQHLLAHAHEILDSTERRDLLTLISWIWQTTTGDISECTGFHGHRNRRILDLIASSSAQCLGSRCSSMKKCFVQKQRNLAQNSHIVIINHALLFADLSTDRGVLGNYRHVILDEAHSLEDTACRFLSRQINYYQIKNIGDIIYDGKRGLAVHLNSTIKKHGSVLGDDAEDVKSRCQRLESQAEQFHSQNSLFFTGLFNALEQSNSGESGHPYFKTRRFKKKIQEDIEISEEEICSAMDGLSRILRDIENVLENHENSPSPESKVFQNILSEIQWINQKLDSLSQDIKEIFAVDSDNHVFWAEWKKNMGGLTLYMRPMDISNTMREDFLNHMDSAVFTSATLAVAGKMDHFQNRTGIKGLEPDRFTQKILGSPFLNDRQVFLGLCDFMPEPGSPDFIKESAETIKDLVLNLKKGTLVLFTSHNMLGKVYSQVKSWFMENRVALLAQDINGSAPSLLDIFRKQRGSCLLGAENFWQGVDVPGSALELVIIVRLPFAVPTEPAVQSQVERMTEQGINAFMEYSLPEAVLKFRQGVGRLVRSGNDRGGIIILDPRISKYYGKSFVAGINVTPRHYKDTDSIIHSFKKWIDV